ncbi:MAG: hypothetical protein ACOCWM_01725 [Cyclobacteriaceae bacterium]
MNTHIKILSSTILLSLLITFSHCGGGDEPEPDQKTDAEEQLERISGSYDLVSVSQDGTDVSGDYTGFTLTMSGNLTANKENVDGTYSSTNGGEVFPASGSWAFAPANVNSQIVLDNDLTVNYSFSGDNLVLVYTFTAPGGRVKVLNGQYRWELSPQ